MLLVKPSAATPTFAFARHDEVVINGITYQPTDRTAEGYILVRLDREDVARSLSYLEMARLVDAGEVEHRRGALLPEAAKARLETVEEIWARSAEEHRRAKMKEAVVLAFLDMERNGKVQRTTKSIKAALSDIKLAAGQILSVPSASDERPADHDVILIPKKSSERSVRRWVKGYESFQLAGLYDKAKQRGGGRHQMEVDALALMSSVVLRGKPRDDGARSIIADNVLDRNFEADRPNQKWLADFTYIWTAEGWLYVAVVLDLFSRRVVGWSMKADRDASLVIDALMMAVWRRGKAPRTLLLDPDYSLGSYQIGEV